MTPIKNTPWVSHFGWLNIIFATTLCITALFAPAWIDNSKPGLFFTLGLQALVSVVLIVTGQQLKAGTDIGHKAYPASLVAYGLFILMAARWLAS